MSEKPVAVPFALMIARLPAGIVAWMRFDGDGAQGCKPPPEEWDPQQLAFDNPHLGCEVALQCQRFPGRLVLAENDAGLLGRIVLANHPVV